MAQIFETILPVDFDGTFRLTNPSDEDFMGKWGGREYLFPSKMTTPIVMPNQTPLEIQNIRKKFAKDLAVREFFKTQRGKTLTSQEKNADGSPRFNSIHMAASYGDDDLKDLIQQCLEPLPIAKPQVKDVPKEPMEDRLSKTPRGKLRTRALGQDESLVAEARGATDQDV
jgi:hypothetical protein